ncbi:MAG: hypothetical protein JNK57_08570 [Planctomycetaceae bacterium]|nr:hypothetical protein [Planctomycetaceae bacterium]
MIEIPLSVVLAMVVAIAVVRLGRIGCGLPLWAAYGIAAVLSSAFGLLIQKVLPRWFVLPEEKQTLGEGFALIRGTWESWLSPQVGDQWMMGMMVVLFATSLLLGIFARYFRTVVGGVVVVAILFGLGCLMFQKMLMGSLYFMPTESALSKAAYVLIPSLVLCLPWLGQWQWFRRMSLEQDGDLRAGLGLEGDSNVHLLSVLALTLSGTLLLATSGTLSVALQLLIFSALPIAWLIEAWLPHRGQSRPLSMLAARSLAGWLTGSAGLLVVLGHLFAEVELGLAGLYAVSLWWVPWLWPAATAPTGRKWGLAMLAAAPALIAAGIAAGTMVAAHG